MECRQAQRPESMSIICLLACLPQLPVADVGQPNPRQGPGSGSTEDERAPVDVRGHAQSPRGGSDEALDDELWGEAPKLPRTRSKGRLPGSGGSGVEELAVTIHSPHVRRTPPPLLCVSSLRVFVSVVWEWCSGGVSRVISHTLGANPASDQEIGLHIEGLQFDDGITRPGHSRALPRRSSRRSVRTVSDTSQPLWL